MSAVSCGTAGGEGVVGGCVGMERGVLVGEDGALCGLRFLSVEPLLWSVWLWGVCVAVVVVAGGEVGCVEVTALRGGMDGSGGGGVCVGAGG